MVKSILAKAIKDPLRAKSVLLSKLYAIFTSKQYSGSSQNRSDSDNGMYLVSIDKFLKSVKSFNRFRRDPFYQAILEHTSKETGSKFLKIIQEQTPGLIENKSDLLLQNDEIGNPTKYKYDSIGMISPSTLHYIKIASDLKILFGEDIKGNIAEIGCGYGGQALILDTIFNIDRITLFDLHLVNKLIIRYLEHFTLKGSYEVSTLNQILPQNYDFVLSNYAFSELPKQIQIKYIEKVLQYSKKGYLIMNTGKGNHMGGGESNRLVFSELEKLLPKFEVFEEKPKTSPYNYVIVWGHKGKLK